MHRTWVNVADVVLALALLVVAVLAVTDGRVLEAVVAVVLALGWGARGALGLRRRGVSAGRRPAGTSRTPRPATR